MALAHTQQGQLFNKGDTSSGYIE